MYKLVRRVSDDIKEYIMRGTYEAYILVKVKDGREYVCALNRQGKSKDSIAPVSEQEMKTYLENRVIWN
jgi:hypothetical protein